MGSAIRRLLVISAMALFVGGSVSANPAMSSVVGYMNLLDVELVIEIEPSVQNDTALSLALLDRLHADAILERPVFTVMVQSVERSELHRAMLAVFLLDVVTGTQPLIDVLGEAGIVAAEGVTLESWLAREAFDPAVVLRVEALLHAASLGAIVMFPRAAELVSVGLVGEMIVYSLGKPDFVAELRGRYKRAVSPRRPIVNPPGPPPGIPPGPPRGVPPGRPDVPPGRR